MISNHVYNPTLPNWQAVRSEFGLKTREPRFVYCVDAADATRTLSILIHSHDGVSFDASFALAYTPTIWTPIASESYEVTVDWLREEDVVPLIAPHVSELGTWLASVVSSEENGDPAGLADEWLSEIASGAVQPWVPGSSLGRPATVNSLPR